MWAGVYLGLFGTDDENAAEESQSPDQSSRGERPERA